MTALLLWILTTAKIALCAAVVGSVYVNILTSPDMFLSWWNIWVWEQYGKVISFFSRRRGEYAYDDLYEKYTWVLKPILTCDLCVAGQIALWSYLFTQPFHIFTLIYTICLTILITRLLAKAIKS